MQIPNPSPPKTDNSVSEKNRQKEWTVKWQNTRRRQSGGLLPSPCLLLTFPESLCFDRPPANRQRNPLKAVAKYAGG